MARDSVNPVHPKTVAYQKFINYILCNLHHWAFAPRIRGMQRLRERLIARYADHYRLVTAEIDPRQIPREFIKYYEANLGELVDALAPGSRVLDLGCGTGLTLSWLVGKDQLVVSGVDRSSSQLEIARQAFPDLELAEDDGREHLLQHPNCFAAILCIDVLEHISGKDAALDWVDAARNALVPGGWIFVQVPNAASLVGAYSRYRDLTHDIAYSTTSILQLLTAAGLRNCRVAPIRGFDPTSRLRLWLERCLHRMLFRICGESREQVFTSNVCAIGYR